jgi:small basic protein
MYVYIHIYICIYTYSNTHINIHTNAYKYIDIGIFMCIPHLIGGIRGSPPPSVDQIQS